MSYLTIKNVKIVGAAACVPKNIEENIDLPIFSGRSEAEKVIEATGIERKRIADPDVTSSDMSFQAASELLDDLGWERESVDVLIYVSYTRDFLVPNTSNILQDRLGLSQGCFCLDLPVGCAGWVFGLGTITALLSNGSMRRGLLICAENNTQNRSAKDKTVKPLFGDAATVTALEYDANFNEEFQFLFGADGSGYQAVWAKGGGARYPLTPDSLVEKEVGPGAIRRDVDVAVAGMDVFAFATRVPPKALRELIDRFEIDVEKIDYLLLHQANRYINERIRKKLGFSPEKTPYCLNDFGNTSGAAIPLTIVTRLADAMKSRDLDCLASGFGVGLSWGCVRFKTDGLKSVVFSEYER